MNTDKQFIKVVPFAKGKETTHRILANIKKTNPKTEKLLIEVNKKVYEAKNGVADVLLKQPITNNLQSLRTTEPLLQIKTFVYNAEKDKITDAKLQEFKLISPEKATYEKADGLLTTSPVIMSDWSKYRVKKKLKSIKKIKIKGVNLLTLLDKGSKNDGTGINFQEGMMFGKNYTFKINGYLNGKPKYKNKINWYLKFHNLTTNQWEEIDLKNKEEQITIKMNNLEMCGRFVYIRAYIDDKKDFAEIKVWKHNRFRWFDRLNVEKEIAERIVSPWKINQSGTSLCGMACIFYLFAKEHPDNYENFSKTLFRTGEATFNKYIVKPSEELFNKTTKPIKINGIMMDRVIGTGGMPLIDYITMAGVRNTDNPDYKGGNEEFEAINWPPLMTTLCEDLLGYSSVSSKGVYNPVKPIAYTNIDIKDKIENINKQLAAGYRLILMIDSDLINDEWDKSSLDLHWVVLESKISEVKLLNEKGETEYLYDFRVYSWGTNPNENRALILNKNTGKMEENSEYHYLKRPITKTHFMNNYNGYIKVK